MLGIKTYEFKDLPSWQQDNPGIVKYYVRETDSFVKSLFTIFFMHSETMNVYTHLIPALYYMKYIHNNFNGTYTPLMLYVSSICTCFTLSSLFHVFKTCSATSTEFWSRMDYLGICILIGTSNLSMVFVGYHDAKEHIIRNVFLFQIFLFTLVCFYDTIMSSRQFCEAKKHHQVDDDNRNKRAKVFSSLALCGLFPMSLGFIIHSFWGVYMRINLPLIILELIMCFIGASIYASKWPEKSHPGKFDLIGSSHQLFHTFIVLGTLCHLKALESNPLSNIIDVFDLKATN